MNDDESVESALALDGKALREELGPRVFEIEGPPNDPELALPEDERKRRQRARWAYGQFCSGLSNARAAASIGFQSSRAGRTEALAVSKEMVDANYRIVRLEESADSWESLNLEMTLESWRQYLEMHGAIAENGAAIVVGTIDRILKQFITRAALSERAIIGGPIVGNQETTLFELIRAGGNWSRHRHEWLNERTRWDDEHENWSIKILSRCMVYHLDENVFTQIVEKLPYRTWVETEEALMENARTFVEFAFAPPYRDDHDDQGHT